MNTLEITGINNINTLCRVCMKLLSEESVSIFGTVNEISLSSKIMILCSIQIEHGDGLPHNVCKCCANQIENAYHFKLKCEDTDFTLRQCLKYKSLECKSTHRSELNGTLSEFIESEVFNNDQDENSVSAETLTQKETCQYVYCDICKKMYGSGTDLEKHKTDHNIIHRDSEQDKFYTRENAERDICLNKSFDKNIGKENSYIHKGRNKKLTCTICNKTYLKASNLSAHMGMHTGNKPFECKICGKCFTQGRAHACHMRTHLKSIDKPHKCCICNKEFAEDTQLSVHMKKHTSQTFKCAVCGKCYANSGNLKSHVRLHTGDKPYECHICGKKFAQSNAHSYHMKIHLGEKPFACDSCPKAFTTNAQLINHKRLHTGERPFACTICPKKFTQKIAHKVHMMVHTGNKPHLCSICGKKYSQNSQLIQHMKTHAGETQQCNVCGKRYSTSGNLAAHMKTHTGVKSHICNICNKGFYVANKLTKHMRTHTGERPYSCTICSKRFATSDVMKVHIRTHTGERPYRCQLCSKSFTNSSQLTVHMKSHIKDNQTAFTCNFCYRSFDGKKIFLEHSTNCSNVEKVPQQIFSANGNIISDINLKNNIT